ncbi:MAG: 16S rRNA (guanine(966)-N(2))-methyltransferase RsmD [Campylobacteraceae bacterium]|nr:16S rRNA (guanine(966)-N(2))-methyltransferase RsmD [Campylobacteraceae bacterium]
MSKLYTQISSGVLKGKKLKLPSLETTRSTKSIVKGSFFDSFRYELEGRVFIECFGGSGLMAAEAVSNGAKMGIAIEKDRDAFSVLKENFKDLSPNLRAINADSFKKVPEILENLDDEVILYLDPPFDIRDGFDDIYKKVVSLVENLNYNDIFLIAIEHNSKVKFDENIAKFSQIKSKKFGSTTLTYFKTR